MDFNKPLTFEEFREAGIEAWKAQAQKELKLDTIDSLQWNTVANISMDPYYDTIPVNNVGKFSQHINPENSFSESPRWWENRQLVTYKNDKETNVVILEALEGGADGIIIKVNITVDFNSLLRDVKAEYCSLSIITGKTEIAHGFIAFLNDLPEKKKITGDILWENTDACQDFIKTADLDSIPDKLRFAGLYPGLSHPLEDQLLFIAGLFMNSDLPATHLEKKVCLTVLMDEDYFQNIARVKAARILLYQILRAFDVDITPGDLFIQAVSTSYKNEKYGPQENMLKGTTAAMAGITGGCNALVIMPEDENSPLMRRVARNISHILKEEAYFDKVIDPSDGSYFLENLIHKTASMIWGNFQDKLK